MPYNINFVFYFIIGFNGSVEIDTFQLTLSVTRPSPSPPPINGRSMCGLVCAPPCTCVYAESINSKGYVSFNKYTTTFDSFLMLK